MDYSNADLQKHLKLEHKQSPFSKYLKEIVYGGNDGIVTTFAVVAGFAGAGAGSAIGSVGYIAVLLFGLANLFADGASMSLGNYLSIRSEQDKYRKEEKKETKEIVENPHIEMAESIVILQKQGFSKEQSKNLANIYSTNKPFWVDFMMKYELEMANPFDDNPVYSGIATFIAFVCFGFIPLLPYIFRISANNSFEYAIASTSLALFLLGLLRYRVTQQSILKSVGEIMLIGGVSASVAFFVGSLFKL